jgi:hypothetical protein
LQDHSQEDISKSEPFEYHELGMDWYHFALIAQVVLGSHRSDEASSRTIVLPGVSPFVGNPGIAALTKPLPFKKLCLDAGLPLSYMNLIETSAVAMGFNPKAW